MQNYQSSKASHEKIIHISLRMTNEAIVKMLGKDSENESDLTSDSEQKRENQNEN